MATRAEGHIDPSKIMQIGMGFWASKTLLTAVNLDLFTHLAQEELSAHVIKDKLGLHNRGLYDFLDTLVALGFLKRRGLKETASYSNSEDTNLFLDKNKPSYIGGMLEMSNNRLYPFWNNLEDGLKTGLPQNEVKTGGKPIFEELYADKKRLREFLKAMGSVQMGNFISFAKSFNFSKYNSHCDLGGAGGHLSVQIAKQYPHMECITYDLPPVGPVATENITAMGLSDRISVQSGDFFKDDIPEVDVITMGNVLHDWGTREKKILIQKAFDALPEDGVLAVIENIIDDNRSENAFGLMMSLNMLVETPEGYDFSLADFKGWASDVGFQEIMIMPLTGPSSAIIAKK
jgi:hypothetical protein